MPVRVDAWESVALREFRVRQEDDVQYPCAATQDPETILSDVDPAQFSPEIRLLSAMLLDPSQTTNETRFRQIQICLSACPGVLEKGVATRNQLTSGQAFILKHFSPTEGKSHPICHSGRVLIERSVSQLTRYFRLCFLYEVTKPAWNGDEKEEMATHRQDARDMGFM